METLWKHLETKTATKFYCKNCDYGTSRKSSYDEHCLSAKHKKNANGNTAATISPHNSAKFCENLLTYFMCDNCNKYFKTRSGLWKHDKKCSTQHHEYKHIPSKQINTNQLELFTEIIKNTIIEVMQNTKHINHSYNTTNHSHNKTFNLNFYLNETCKDAINIGDFIKSIKVQLQDLEHTGRVGYVDGVSDIIINNLNSIDSHKRPLHCTDEKREVLYIKNDGVKMILNIY